MMTSHCLPPEIALCEAIATMRDEAATDDQLLDAIATILASTRADAAVKASCLNLRTLIEGERR